MSVEQQIDRLKSEYEEPLMRGLTRQPDGLSVQEVMELVKDGGAMRELAKTARTMLHRNHLSASVHKK
jgi:urease gamma subunit